MDTYTATVQNAHGETMTYTHAEGAPFGLLTHTDFREEDGSLTLLPIISPGVVAPSEEAEFELTPHYEGVIAYGTDDALSEGEQLFVRACWEFAALTRPAQKPEERAEEARHAGSWFASALREESRSDTTWLITHGYPRGMRSTIEQTWTEHPNSNGYRTAIQMLAYLAGAEARRLGYLHTPEFMEGFMEELSNPSD